GNAYDLQAIGNQAQQHNALVPWFRGQKMVQPFRFQTVGGPGGAPQDSMTIFMPAAGTLPIDATQPEARQWLLVRQPVVLVDDDQANKHTNQKTVYAGEIQTERSIFLWNEPMQSVFGGAYTASFPARMILNGRVDAAATQM